MSHRPRVAFVLAAGKGTRLAPLTDERPKPLVEVVGLPLVEVALQHAKRAGVEVAVLNSHHLHPAIPDALGEAYDGMPLLYSHEPVLLGTGGGFKVMHQVLQQHRPDLDGGPYLAINADAFCDFDVAAFVDAHDQAANAHDVTGSMLLKAVPDADKYGVIGTDADGRVVDFAGRAKLDADVAGQFMFCGIHIFTQKLLDRLPEPPYAEGGMCVNREGYPKAILDGEWVQGVVTDAYFQDVGTKERLLNVHTERMALVGTDATHLALHAGLDERAPGVWVHPDADVADDVTFTAPVVVRQASVGSGAQLGPHVAVGKGAKVGEGAQLRRAVLQSGATVAPETSVADAILGSSVVLQTDPT